MMLKLLHRINKCIYIRNVCRPKFNLFAGWGTNIIAKRELLQAMLLIKLPRGRVEIEMRSVTLDLWIKYFEGGK